MAKYRHLDERNTLALLPIPASALEQFDSMLCSINEGNDNATPGCIADLIKINKKTRFNKISFKRFSKAKKNKVVAIFRFILFDAFEDSEQYFYSYENYNHGTPQSPMLMCYFDRMKGKPPKEGLDPPEGTYVQSRRILSVPLQCILKGWGDVERGHMVYEHNISPMDFTEPQFKSVSYIGITSRNWQTRYKEHQRDALNGSNLIFHTTLRETLNCDGIIQSGVGAFDVVRKGAVLLSELQYVNLVYEYAMDIEEKMVERTLYPKGLNMIPGGFAGFKFLHKLGYLAKEKTSLEDRDYAANKYITDKGSRPHFAPWVTENWAKDEYYEQVIFKRNNTLNRDQVLSIRKYGGEWGFDCDVIANLVGANPRQVRDVLSSKYYSRVK